MPRSYSQEMAAVARGFAPGTLAVGTLALCLLARGARGAEPDATGAPSPPPGQTSAPSPASPNPASPNPASPSPATPASARELFLEAERRYEAADYESALRLLHESYDLATPELRIGLLFNLAQAYRQLDRCEKARDYYADYLTRSRAKSPALGQRRDDARFYWQKLNAECPVNTSTSEASLEPAPRAAAVASITAPVLPEAPPPPAAEPLGLNKVVGWSLLGAGVAAAAGSVVYGLATARAEADVERLGREQANYAERVQPRVEEGELYEKYAWILGGGALFCAGVGSALLLLDPSSDPAPPAVGVVANPAGGFIGAHYNGAF